MSIDRTVDVNYWPQSTNHSISIYKQDESNPWAPPSFANTNFYPALKTISLFVFWLHWSLLNFELINLEILFRLKFPRFPWSNNPSTFFWGYTQQTQWYLVLSSKKPTPPPICDWFWLVTNSPSIFCWLKTESTEWCKAGKRKHSAAQMKISVLF